LPAGDPTLDGWAVEMPKWAEFPMARAGSAADTYSGVMTWLIGLSAYLSAVALVVLWWARLPRGDWAPPVELEDQIELEERHQRSRDLGQLGERQARLL
jgi:hypothetical protein